MEWLGFWIFLAVVVICDHWIFAQGYNGLILHHKTEAEKELQRLAIEERRQRVSAGGTQSTPPAVATGNVAAGE